jgi:hypothetical protein
MSHELPAPSGDLRLVLRTKCEPACSGGTEQAVAALEQQWLQSQKTNSPDVLAPLLADKLVSTNSDGQVAGKAETLARAKSIKYDFDQQEWKTAGEIGPLPSLVAYCVSDGIRQFLA